MGRPEDSAICVTDGLLRLLDERECESAWKKDPLGGVIGVQKGPLC
jgi:hypothetical protein